MKKKRLIAVIAAFAVVVALPAAATAQERDATPREQVVDNGRSIESIKERAAEAIDRRLATLDRLTEKVSQSETMTLGHKDKLFADYVDAARGLTMLGQEIEAATTYEQLRELVPLIATDYRVYLVIAPKTHMVAISDKIGANVPRFEAGLAKIGEKIARAEEAGWDVAEAARLLNEAEANLAEGARLAAPVAGNVIGLDAADWPDPAEATLEANRKALRASHAQLKAARENARAAIQALRDAAPDGAIDTAVTDTVTTDG
ncbi:MAG: hypothetical protein GXP36_14085 [Actinobacteria bacterium]|nr:hypothetical protein [Actinomycetota bacterium]